jgi:hypothetical protein
LLGRQPLSSSVQLGLNSYYLLEKVGKINFEKAFHSKNLKFFWENCNICRNYDKIKSVSCFWTTQELSVQGSKINILSVLKSNGCSVDKFSMPGVRYSYISYVKHKIQLNRRTSDSWILLTYAKPQKTSMKNT